MSQLDLVRANFWLMKRENILVGAGEPAVEGGESDSSYF
jgi:hypothetical protein